MASGFQGAYLVTMACSCLAVTGISAASLCRMLRDST